MQHVRRKALPVLLFAVLTTAVGCGRHSLLPPPPIIEGWDYSERPQTYHRETLFRYINGKARAYLDYGFAKLDHAQFAPRRGKPVIDVDVYDMGSPTGAFGIYSLERGDELPLHYKKRLGYMVGSARFFWKGRHYVTITSPDPSPETVDAINTLSLYLEGSVPGDSQEVPVLAAFPAEEKVPESEQYFAVNFLGHEFMGGGFVAGYNEKGSRFRLFMAEKESPEFAAEAYRRLKQSLSDYGELIAEANDIGESAFKAKDNYVGNWLVSLNGSYVIGAIAFHDEECAQALLRELTRNVSRLR